MIKKVSTVGGSIASHDGGGVDYVYYLLLLQRATTSEFICTVVFASSLLDNDAVFK